MEETKTTEILKKFLLSLLSRKFLIAMAASYIAYNAGYSDGVLTTEELLTALSPLLAYMGIEGASDFQQRSAEGKAKVEEKKVEVEEAKTETAKVELQTAKAESSSKK